MQNPITKKSQQGFTLIELLIVVAIIGILAAIAIPQYAQYRTAAMDSAAQNELKNLRTDLEGYYSTGNYAYPSTTANTLSDFEFSTSKKVTIEYVAPTNQTYKACAWHDGGETFYSTNASLSSMKETKCSDSGFITGGTCDGCGYPSSLGSRANDNEL